MPFSLVFHFTNECQLLSESDDTLNVYHHHRQMASYYSQSLSLSLVGTLNEWWSNRMANMNDRISCSSLRWNACFWAFSFHTFPTRLFEICLIRSRKFENLFFEIFPLKMEMSKWKKFFPLAAALGDGCSWIKYFLFPRNPFCSYLILNNSASGVPMFHRSTTEHERQNFGSVRESAGSR